MTVLFEQLQEAVRGRYQLEREIGRGGMATVFLAHDRRHQRKVAIKALYPEFAASIGSERFAREIAIAAVLTHPHIVPLYDSGAANGVPYYVMPFIDGESLGRRLAREGPLPLADVAHIVREVADALDYAHRAGIVHRDIKPDNVLLTGGHALVADFGIARAVDAANAGRLTSTGLSMGTPHYMSPEQMFGDEALDGRTDLYALACVAYEMLAGRPPYDGESGREVSTRHLHAAIPRITRIRADVPAAADTVLLKALAKKPTERWATAGAFADAFGEALGVVGPPTGANSRAMPLMRRPSFVRTHARAITGGLALLAGVAGLTWWARESGRREAAAAVPTTRDDVVAVLPFRVVGDASFQYLREGMVDLLSTKLAALPGVQAADTRAVLSAWQRAMHGANDPTLDEARAIARTLGSGRFVLGDIVATPRGLQISARLLDANGSGRVEAAEQGEPDSLFSLVDKVALQLLARSAGETRRLAELTSTSLPAVRAYLAGRSALRRGEAQQAISYFTEALETDSTFALAALGMAASGAWSQQAGQSQALRRGLRTGYALRGRLSRRDQLLFEALVLPGDPKLHTAAEQLGGWERAIALMADSPEAQYAYGDRFYHTGAQLGVQDAAERAARAFNRTLALDSAWGQPTGHLVEMAVQAGDRARARALLTLYRASAGSADAGDYVLWRAAVGLDDDALRARVLAQRTTMPLAALNRIVGFGQADGVGLDDVDDAAAEITRRARQRTAGDNAVHPAQTLHSWARNRGRAAATADAIALLRESGPIPPGFSIVYFDADQVPVLDALFWDGDSTTAAAAVTRLAARAGGPLPRESGARAIALTNRCVELLWAARTTDVRRDPRFAVLRSGVGDSVGVHGGDPALCVALLDAMGAVRADARGTDAATAVRRLDSIAVQGPYQFGIDFANLALARLQAQRGDSAAALRTVRRRPYDWDTAPLYLSSYLLLEARLAAATGDRAGASRAYDHWLALRSNVDAPLRAEVTAVRAERAKRR
ncbi:MAG: serine/threonine protein kinase [Gemmatimonadetes bacterium]|nr:serine/threonine protein kinase [Gemmatimonadota bacterium]